MAGEIAEAGFHRVEARFRAEHREPGRPDVGGDEMAAFVHSEDDFEQVAAVQSQDGATVGADVADLLQFDLYFFHGGEGREEDEVVHLAHGVVAFVDVADLAAEDEAHLTPTRRGHLFTHSCGKLVFEAEETVLGGFEFGAHLLQPAGVGHIPCGEEVDPLDLRPLPQMLEGQVLARGAGIVGVDVEIGGDEHELLMDLIRIG